jgi:hypothetical protein
MASLDIYGTVLILWSTTSSILDKLLMEDVQVAEKTRWLVAGVALSPRPQWDTPVQE